MGDFLYRLGQGLTGRKLIEQLQDEQPQGATPADDPPVIPGRRWRRAGRPAEKRRTLRGVQHR